MELVGVVASRFVRGHRGALRAVVDVTIWVVAIILATAVRYDFDLAHIDLRVVLFLPVAILAVLVAGMICGLYTGRWWLGSFEEVVGVSWAVILATVGIFVLDVWIGVPRLVPVGAVLAAGFMALVGMSGVRYVGRLIRDQQRRPGENASRVLVFGAGEGAVQVVKAMMNDPRTRYVPVALLDDDDSKRGLRIIGVPVVGDRLHLAAAAQRYEAEALLIAIPSATSELLTELSLAGKGAGLEVKVLPSVSEVFGAVGVSDIRSVTDADLMGRRAVHTDVDAIAGYLRDKRVLVTGAGGSIGSELCRQIHRYAPAQLTMVDRDESGLHAVGLSLNGRVPLDSPDMVVADIRDARRLRQLFDEHRPEVVFHAAALKHVPLLERHPGEAVRTNVWGTLNVLEAAAGVDVERFVNVSTDKAADPCAVLGYTKRITERLTAHVGANVPGTYLSVRFGNVLGSRGSVLVTFHAQVAAGGPITVTDPDATRYFMTTEEAVELVIQAGAIGHDGEGLVLDMGKPVRIDEVARRLVANADRPIDIVYTGLRPGEKLHEVLLGEGEVDVRPVHPLISHVQVPPLDPTQVRELDPLMDPTDLVASLKPVSGAPALNGGIGRRVHPVVSV